MSKDVEAPCEACGGLLPLKAIQTRRRERHRQSCSLHPKQNNPNQPDEKSTGKSYGRQPEQGSTSQSKGARESRRSRQFSSDSDGQAEVMSSRNRLNYELGEQFQAAKPAVLQQFQAAFAHQKRKKEVIRCGIHRDQELTERKPNSPIPQAQCKACQPPVSDQHDSVVKHKLKKTLSPGDLDLPCHLHQHEENTQNESTCTRIVGHLSRDDVSKSSSNPSVCNTHKVRHVATQMSCKRLLAVSKQSSRRENIVQQEATVAVSTQSGSASTKTYNRAHAAHEHHHHEECHRRATSPPELYPGVISLYEECHLHHIEEHISTSQRSSSRDSIKLQRCNNHPKEDHLHTEPQMLFTCHQRVRHQSVVQHHEVCHLHPHDDPEEPAPQSPISRDSAKLSERCGLPAPARNEFSPQETRDRKLSHHSSKAYVKIESLCAQMITPRSEAHSPCILHGDCGSEKVETCGTCWHPKTDHMNESKTSDEPKKSKKGRIHGCHLHREPPASPKRQESKDPMVWTPRRAAKPRPCTSVRWLDRIIASQNIPPQIIREFLQGKREWPPAPMKQKCLGCNKKHTHEDDSPRDTCPREFDVTSWNPGSSVAQPAVECVKEHHDEKLARLLMARTQIIKPVVKLSTSKEVWRSRKELQVCSECWNPTKFGRWAFILDEMSKDVAGATDMSNCDRKFSTCTAHGNPNPCDTGDVNLHCPQLFSTFNLRLQARELQNAIFDRKTALKACGISSAAHSDHDWNPDWVAFSRLRWTDVDHVRQSC
ncbi:hypothetical protein M758_5G154000 [Ceratodon purpureus]|nr:hypothetical protein M758_5G154000 [Ceratodon purpureus]